MNLNYVAVNEIRQFKGKWLWSTPWHSPRGTEEHYENLSQYGRCMVNVWPE